MGCSCLSLPEIPAFFAKVFISDFTQVCQIFWITCISHRSCQFCGAASTPVKYKYDIQKAYCVLPCTVINPILLTYYCVLRIDILKKITTMEERVGYFHLFIIPLHWKGILIGFSLRVYWWPGDAKSNPGNMVHGANMGPLWGWLDPCGPHELYHLGGYLPGVPISLWIFQL